MIPGAWVQRFAWVAMAFALAGWQVRPALAAETAASYPWGHPGCPCATVLHTGTAAEAGLLPASLADIDGTLSRVLVRRVTPGAVVLVARRGVIAKWQAYGYASLYKNGDYALVGDPVAMHKDTIFDLASVTKLFTATAVMQLWDEGKFKLDDPVAKYLPAFGVHGKANVTIRELLTHTSGFQPDPPTPLYEIPGTRKDRLAYVLQLPLAYPPGTHYVYSDINFITLGALVEKLSGEREDVFLRKHLTAPLHMRDTLFDPPASLRPRIAASEYQPSTKRGLLWGQVDDENAWALDGVAGHAGLFSTAHDLAVFGQMMLDGGSYDGVRVLSQRAVQLLLTNWDKPFPDNATGLGWSIDRGYFMGALSGPDAAGHEGFTGTTLVIDTSNDLVGVLLMNRVHPNRHGASDVVARREFYTNVADAIPVAPPGGKPAWFSGYGDYLNRTLTAAVKPHRGTTLSFQTWYRLQPDDDYGSVEASTDGVHWKVLDLVTGDSRGWQAKHVALPADARYIQFRYRTDAAINGRGWYVSGLETRADGTTSQPVITRNEWSARDN